MYRSIYTPMMSLLSYMYVLIRYGYYYYTCSNMLYTCKMFPVYTLILIVHDHQYKDSHEWGLYDFGEYCAFFSNFISRLIISLSQLIKLEDNRQSVTFDFDGHVPFLFSLPGTKCLNTLPILLQKSQVSIKWILKCNLTNSVNRFVQPFPFILLFISTSVKFTLVSS